MICLFSILVFLSLPSSLVAIAYSSKTCDRSNSVLFLPLDERYTTRDAFIMLAQSSDYCILTPDKTLLPYWKQDCDINALHKWVESTMPKVKTAIISSEMYLYGGLITSRRSNETLSTITKRLDKLVAYTARYPDINMFVSNVVMRIPAYNGDFEEPWFWADSGFNIFSYSFYTDKYSQLGNPDDKQTADYYAALVPENALNEFVWRRQRNHNVTNALLNVVSRNKNMRYLYITLDDNAEYGFNIRESEELKSRVVSMNLTARVPIYPGADEVQMVQLARFASEDRATSIKFALIFRDPSTVNYIPNYEGQAMKSTLIQQLEASGSTVIISTDEGSGSVDAADALLFVNNFSEETQLEAKQQALPGDQNDYVMYDKLISAELSKAAPRPMGFCDNRYSNGADISFVDYMISKTKSDSLNNVAYAGWNTNGNTIGTVVANTVLLNLFRNGQNNAAFNSLRILEDMHYQANYRQGLVSYVSDLNSSCETFSNLTSDLLFYQQYMFKPLGARYREIVGNYSLPLTLNSIFYPWNRTFEIGFHSDWNEALII